MADRASDGYWCTGFHANETDGLIEFLGRDALGRALKNTVSCSVIEACDRILSEVCTWAAVQDDDLTLILCEFCQLRISV
jgi:hypothetical protein